MLSDKILSGVLVVGVNTTFLISGLFCLQYSYSFSDANWNTLNNDLIINPSMYIVGLNTWCITLSYDLNFNNS